MRGFIASILLLLTIPSVSSQCVQGGFSLDVEDECNFETLLESFTPFFEDPVNSGGTSCPYDSAEQDLILLLGATTRAEAEDAVHTICVDMFENYPMKVPFENIPGYDRDFVGRYYNGGTKWNEQYATKYAGGEDGELTQILRQDAAQVKTFYESGGQYGMVEWPDYLPNFEECSMNAAYCCWPQDRQARDNNGNCNEPYDENCIDRDPGDNTDLCYMDIADGNSSTGKTGDGLLGFPLDDGNNGRNAEGPIHCHGFAWSDDDAHASAAYKANNLFYVSMYDHMHQRGYVRNIDGAPMCACAEQVSGFGPLSRIV